VEVVPTSWCYWLHRSGYECTSFCAVRSLTVRYISVTSRLAAIPVSTLVHQNPLCNSSMKSHRNLDAPMSYRPKCASDTSRLMHARFCICPNFSLCYRRSLTGNLIPFLHCVFSSLNRDLSTSMKWFVIRNVQSIFVLPAHSTGMRKIVLMKTTALDSGEAST
jgi:hypothetical protein